MDDSPVLLKHQGLNSLVINIQPVNDPPVPIDQVFAMLEDGGMLKGEVTGYDPDGELVTYSLGCPPKKGTVIIDSSPTMNTSPFLYTPDPQENGEDSFVFIISDGVSEAAGLVIIDITPQDDPPTAEDLYITLYTGKPTEFTLPIYDPDGSPMEIYIMTEPAGRSETIALTDESSISIGGSRRKVTWVPNVFFSSIPPILAHSLLARTILLCA